MKFIIHTCLDHIFFDFLWKPVKKKQNMQLSSKIYPEAIQKSLEMFQKRRYTYYVKVVYASKLYRTAI